MLESILSSVVTSGVLIACAGFILKQYWEKRVKHYFDERLQRLSAELGVKSALEIDVNKKRVEGYGHIARLLKQTRKIEEVVFQAGPTCEQALLEEWKARTEELERAIYDHVLSLRHDGFYEQLHRCKNDFVTARNYIIDQRILIQEGIENKSSELTEIISKKVKSNNANCDSVVQQLEQATQNLILLRAPE